MKDFNCLLTESQRHLEVGGCLCSVVLLYVHILLLFICNSVFFSLAVSESQVSLPLCLKCKDSETNRKNRKLEMCRCACLFRRTEPDKDESQWRSN